MNALRFAIGALLIAASAHADADEDCAECRNPAPVPPPAVPPVQAERPLVYVEPPPFVHDPVATMLASVDVGPVYSRTLQRNFGGMRLDLQLGADLKDFMVSGRFGLEAGGTQSGLGYERLTWGLGVDRKLGSRVRVGGEARFGMLIIDRVSDTSDPLIGFTAGVHAELAVALVSPGRRPQRQHPALDFVVRAGYDWIDVSNGSPDASDSFSLKIGLGGRY
jgi:hypothetical protein